MDNYEEIDALPNGKIARKEWADGHDIQFKSRRDNSLPWEDVDENNHTLDIFNKCYWFRLKPKTLTVNAELPKPSNTTLHNQNYSVTYEFSSREDRNAFVKGLGGNNS